MLAPKSRVFRKEGGWTHEANSCGREVLRALKEIFEEWEGYLSPDEFEYIVISEVGTMSAQDRIRWMCEESKKEKE